MSANEILRAVLKGALTGAVENYHKFPKEQQIMFEKSMYKLFYGFGVGTSSVGFIAQFVYYKQKNDREMQNIKSTLDHVVHDIENCKPKWDMMKINTSLSEICNGFKELKNEFNALKDELNPKKKN